MKQISIIAMALLIAGCGVSTSSNVNVDGDDVRYVQDERTGLCFAVTASRKAFKVDTTGLGFTNVPCTEEVLALVK